MEKNQPSRFQRVHATNPNHLHPRNLNAGDVFEVWRYWDNKWDTHTTKGNSIPASEIEVENYPINSGDWIVPIIDSRDEVVIVFYNNQERRWEYMEGYASS